MTVSEEDSRLDLNLFNYNWTSLFLDHELIEDDSDLDPSYDPHEPEDINPVERRKRKLANYFQAGQ